MLAPHLSPPDLFQLGVSHYKEYRPLPAWHDVTHLKAGGMVDDRAYVRANNLSDGALCLEGFRPNSLTQPDNDLPLRDMREVQRAFSLYMALVRRQRPWDFTPELILDYLVDCEWFGLETRPFSGFYRRWHTHHTWLSTP